MRFQFFTLLILASMLFAVSATASDYVIIPPSLDGYSTAKGEELITTIALSQLRLGPFEVGRELQTYPFNLGRYLGKNEAWCSEFVSWVYLLAGLPLINGENGWLFRGSVQIREWFQGKNRFISSVSPQWQEFSPASGDYIRYNTNFGGHSGLVCRVSGEDMYTVEGNVNNRVVYRKIRNWRQRTDIDGFGIVRPQD